MYAYAFGLLGFGASLTSVSLSKKSFLTDCTVSAFGTDRFLCKQDAQQQACAILCRNIQFVGQDGDGVGYGSPPFFFIIRCRPKKNKGAGELLEDRA